jgi:hypothetical protein
MARVNQQMLAFNGGEIGGQALARVDLDIYARCAEVAENVTPYTQGSVAKAPGTQFLRETPFSNVTVVRPFVFNESQTFVLELSNNLVRFIQGDGYVTLPGADASVGAWSDVSTTPPAGGDPPSSGGTGGVSDPTGPSGGTYGGSYGSVYDFTLSLP